MTLSSWSLAVRLAAALILLFLLLPSLITIVISVGETNQIVFPPRGISLNLFRRFFSEEGWVASTWLSLRIAVWATLLSLLVGVPAAYALARGRFPGRKTLAVFLLSPIMVPHVAVALALYIYFAKLGITDGELRLALAHCVATLPFVIVMAGAGINQIDPSLERAATVMGAGKLTILRSVTLPLLKPSLVAGALLAFLMSFDEVTISWFVARAGDTTLPVKMFSSIQFEVSPVLAAVSTMLTGLSVIVCVLVALVQREAARD